MREVALTKVTIPCGVIVGCNDEDSQVGVFRGITYAKPPVGELRWREPQPVGRRIPGIEIRADGDAVSAAGGQLLSSGMECQPYADE